MLKSLFKDESGLPLTSQIVSTVLSTFFIALGLYYYSQSDALITRYTKEDGFLEWMTFLIYFSTALLMIFVAVSRRLQNQKTNFFQTAIVLGLAAIFFFGAFEEISWFQRVIGVQSGEFFMAYNRQAETNVHNLVVKGVSVNRLIFGKIFFIAVLIHNVVLPIWSRKNAKVKNWLLDKGIFLPPKFLIVGYILLVLIIDRSVAHSRVKEHFELLGSLHYFSALFATYGLGFGFTERKELYVFHDRLSQKQWSIAFGFFLILMTMTSWILGNISLMKV